MERLHIGTLSLMDIEILSGKVKIDFLDKNRTLFSSVSPLFLINEGKK